MSNCSTSGSGKSSFSHSVTGLVQKVSKPNRLPLPGFENKYVTDWILPPRASPSQHSCAECAHRQKFASLVSSVAGSSKGCILHMSPCSPIWVEIQDSSFSSTLRYCSEIEIEQRHRENGNISSFGVVRRMYT